MAHHVVFVNPSAGSVEDGVAPDVLAAIEQGGTVEVVEVRGDDDLRTATADLAEDVVLIVIGGDGTLHRTVNALPHLRRPYLLVPGGTGNDFATGFGLPEGLAEAAGLAHRGELVPLDLVDVGGTLAVNAAHVGIGVEAAEAAQGLKSRLGKVAYPAGALSAAMEFEPSTITATLDGEVVIEERPVALLAICNGPLVGGGTALCPVALHGDGEMDLVVFLADTVPALAATTAAMVRGAHLERDDVIHRRGQRLEVVVHGCESVTWNIDGELVDRPPAVDCVLRPSAWQMFGPQT